MLKILCKIENGRKTATFYLKNHFYDTMTTYKTHHITREASRILCTKRNRPEIIEATCFSLHCLTGLAHDPVCRYQTGHWGSAKACRLC